MNWLLSILVLFYGIMIYAGLFGFVLAVSQLARGSVAVTKSLYLDALIYFALTVFGTIGIAGVIL